MDKINLPITFLDTIRQQLPNEIKGFVESLDDAPPTSIRINSSKQFPEIQGIQSIPWNSNGYYLPQRPIFTLDPHFHAGAYYVQEASSMFLGHLVRQLFTTKDAPKLALDLCAAPGGKSTLLLQELPPNSLLVANEIIKGRFNILKENLIKWGNPNYVVTNHDSQDFANLNGRFDLVLVDAPCSGEGLFRKDPNAINEWSLDHVKLCSARQKRILGDAAKLVKENGYLIYSTCTYNPSENQENVKWLAENFDLSLVDFDIPEAWGILKTSYGYQFYPHRVKGEGFFIACLKHNNNYGSRKGSIKPFGSLKRVPKKQHAIFFPLIVKPKSYEYFESPKGELIAISKQHLEMVQLISQQLKRTIAGTTIGQIKHQQFIPAHDLAVSTIIQEDLPGITVAKQAALEFLKKLPIEVGSTPPGWNVVKYEGNNLGWIKVLKNRVNNYYPKNWRIRMDINQ